MNYCLKSLTNYDLTESRTLTNYDLVSQLHSYFSTTEERMFVGTTGLQSTLTLDL